ncbi:MAG: hypothetical protein A2675_02285 [Candidatus Yonathbacteria bacterium RIFCSPHIGHO2_01_FULL_51_10]|uniref:LysM domain-containing protein n=1 Tax=Candidatus Yonathbacteria bacterium RIFCSPHIGHO2_01_FULL_51_10 TaxID=1802723 RepID=A0A1G2S763_9BACT|nr:MAG: hypothetical protein A2675_02285 [Candidatus Yonathbacteria bacterium RIFCSPHIGHO2_01_FULL_51_10]
MSQSSSSSPSASLGIIRWYDLAISAIWAIIGFGLFMRVWGLGAEGLRLDESQSVWQAMHSLDFIREYMLKNVHLPLHNSLLHLWMLLFGPSEASVRTLALIPGILSVPALYFLAREFIRPRWALYATAIAALSPFWVWYSREIRMYSLLTLITIFSYYAYVKILKENRVRWYVLYALVNIVGMYTHYFFFLILLVQLVYFFLTWRVRFSDRPPGEQVGEKRTMLRRFVLVGAVLVAGFVPWLYLLVTNYGSGSLAPILEKPDAFNVILQFYEFMFGFHTDTLTASLVGGWPILILGSFFFLSKRAPSSPLILLLPVGILLPVAIGFIASQYLPLFLSRYFIIVTPLLFIFVAWFIGELPTRSRIAVGGVFLAVLSVLLINQSIDPRVPTRENYREATQYISSQVGPRDIVVASPPYLVYPTQYYYHGDAMLTTYPIWDKRKGGIPAITDEILEQDLRAIKVGHSRIFFLVSTDLYGSKESKTYLDTHLTKIAKHQFSKNLWVHVYQAEYASKASPTPTGESWAESEEIPKGMIHVVAPGETLSKITFRYYGDYLQLSRIQKINGIRDPKIIHPGDILSIPEITPQKVL